MLSPTKREAHQIRFEEKRLKSNTLIEPEEDSPVAVKSDSPIIAPIKSEPPKMKQNDMLNNILNDNDSDDEADIRASVQISPDKLLQLKPQEKSVVSSEVERQLGIRGKTSISSQKDSEIVTPISFTKDTEAQEETKDGNSSSSND